jgi:hypothetical protein
MCRRKSGIRTNAENFADAHELMTASSLILLKFLIPFEFEIPLYSYRLLRELSQWAFHNTETQRIHRRRRPFSQIMSFANSSNPTIQFEQVLRANLLN